MMGRKAIESARIFVESSGLTGLLSPEAFLEERESMLQELFPSCTLLPGTVLCLRNVKVISVAGGRFCVLQAGRKSLSEPDSTVTETTFRFQSKFENVPDVHQSKQCTISDTWCHLPMRSGFFWSYTYPRHLSSQYIAIGSGLLWCSSGLWYSTAAIVYTMYQLESDLYRSNNLSLKLEYRSSSVPFQTCSEPL